MRFKLYTDNYNVSHYMDIKHSVIRVYPDGSIYVGSEGSYIYLVLYMNL